MKKKKKTGREGSILFWMSGQEVTSSESNLAIIVQADSSFYLRSVTKMITWYRAACWTEDCNSGWKKEQKIQVKINIGKTRCDSHVIFDTTQLVVTLCITYPRIKRTVLIGW